MHHNRYKGLGTNYVQLTDEELLEEGLDHLSEACSFFYELESDQGKALAYIANCCLTYAQAILSGSDPLLSDEFYDTKPCDTIE